jgi:hemerythrin
MQLSEIVWNKQYEIGIDDIDVQHHYFANLINPLGKHLLKPGDLDYKKSLVNELNAYARFHFTSEENLMKLEGYPPLGRTQGAPLQTSRAHVDQAEPTTAQRD